MLIHKIIVMHQRAILIGRKRQRKEDAIIAAKIKEEHHATINDMIDAHANEKQLLKDQHSKEITLKIEENERDLSRMQEKCDLEIKKLKKQNDAEVAAIRNQVRSQYEPILQERNHEIARLNKEKEEQKKYYKSILDYGIAMETSGERAAGYFTRAQSKVVEAAECAEMSRMRFAEAMQLVDRGNSCVEAIQQTVGKTTPRLLRVLKD